MASRTDAVIVGAGASGLVCAGFAANRGRRVVLLEKMERPARKLMITGKGRCNLTNNCTRDELIAAVKTNGRFLYGAFSAFSPVDIMELTESLGVKLKTERGNRVFPVSDKAVDVVDALVKFAKQNGAEILTQTSCKSLVIKDGRVAGVKTTADTEIAAESVVIATGGLSYPLTGSTGDGYHLAEQAEHTIIGTRPSLVPLELEEHFCSELMGLSLRNCKLTLKRQSGEKPVFDEIGELLFTHFGVSGPLVLSASAHMDGSAADWRLFIDLKPGLTPEQLDARILRDFSANLNRDFQNSLSELLPRKLIPVIVRCCGINGAVKVNSITKKQRRDFVALLKAFPLTPKAFRPISEAVVTSGGVSVKEINPKTMESKLVSGLFFAGEVIDADAYTGGYNLQIAFSTGYLAGQNI